MCCGGAPPKADPELPALPLEATFERLALEPAEDGGGSALFNFSQSCFQADHFASRSCGDSRFSPRCKTFVARRSCRLSLCQMVCGPSLTVVVLDFGFRNAELSQLSTSNLRLIVAKTKRKSASRSQVH